MLPWGGAARRLALAGLVVVAGLSASLYGSAQEAGVGADMERGRGIAVGTFETDADAACFRCHGMQGAGDAVAAFPRLADQVYDYLVKSLQDYASGLRQDEIMQPIAAALTEQQMRDVSLYYSEQENVEYQPPPENPDVEVLQLGAALAAVGSVPRGVQACINCHGPDGTGLVPYPYLAGQHQSYLEAQLLAWKNGERDGDPLDVMAHIASQLTEDEIAAVALYYASVRPARMPGAEGAVIAPRDTGGEE